MPGSEGVSFPKINPIIGLTLFIAATFFIIITEAHHVWYDAFELSDSRFWRLLLSFIAIFTIAGLLTLDKRFDETTFALSEDARMVIDELVYDPGSSSNTALACPTEVVHLLC